MTITQYWNTEDVPPYIARLLESFRENNRWADYRLFNETSAARFISSHFSERESAAFRSCAVPAMQADYFRYCAVFALGGAYADADMRCVSNLGPLLEHAFDAGTLFLRENGNIMNAFFLFRSKGSPFLRTALDIATENIENRIAEDVWLVTGPWVFTFMGLVHKLGSLAATKAYCANQEHDWIQPYVDLHCQTIDDVRRLTDVFQTVQVLPESVLRSYVQMVDSARLPYKDSEGHWTNVKGSIYRAE
jgi:mannosyltransferase OCH1-like enzyme